MKSSLRWGLFFAGIGLLVLCLFYLIPWYSSPYPMPGWRTHHMDPGAFSWYPFLGLGIASLIGFAWYKILFPSSGETSLPREEKEKSCPFCVGDYEGCARRRETPCSQNYSLP